MKYVVELEIRNDSSAQKLDRTTMDYINMSIDNAPTDTGSGIPTFEIIQEKASFRVSYVGVKPLERQIIGGPSPLPDED